MPWSNSHLNTIRNRHSCTHYTKHSWVAQNSLSHLFQSRCQTIWQFTLPLNNMLLSSVCLAGNLSFMHSQSYSMSHKCPHCLHDSLSFKCMQWGRKELSIVTSWCVEVYIWWCRMDFDFFLLWLPPPWCAWQDLFSNRGLWRWQWVLSLNLRQQLLFSEDFLWPQIAVSTK